jgi:hypothetical protein
MFPTVCPYCHQSQKSDLWNHASGCPQVSIQIWAMGVEHAIMKVEPQYPECDTYMLGYKIRKLSSMV